MEIQFEKKALEIRLALQAYNPSFSPPDPIVLSPELHVKQCSLCYEFGHTTMDCPELCPLLLRQKIIT
jgi:hypothetical protein